MKRGKKQKRTSPLSLMNLKVSKSDRAALLANANRYMKGNLSAWLRTAGMKFKPGKDAAHRSR